MRKTLSRRAGRLALATAGTLVAVPLATPALAATDDNGREIEELIVEGSRISAFRIEDTSTAGIFDMPIEETPFNIGVITEDLIKERQLFTLRDAVLSNAAVKRSHSHSSTTANFNIRGFNLNADRLGYLINGVPVASFDAPPAHVSALERIEVLKGSAALYYGAGEPAGVINYVYKKPQTESKYAFSATAGQFDDYRIEADATGALGSERLTYRVTLGWRDSQGIVDYDYAKDFAPTVQLQWQATDATTIRLLGEYVEHEGNPLSQDAVFLGGDFIDAPKSAYYGFSTDYEEKESVGVQLHVDHAFSDSLKMRVQAGWKDGGRDAGNSGYAAELPLVFPGLNDPANGLLFRSVFDQRREAESEYLAAHVAWDVETGGISHQLVAGVNYSTSKITNIGNFNSPIAALFSGNLALLATIPPSVNVFNPTVVPFDHRTNFNDSPPFYRDVWEYDNLGLNLQDAIDIPALNLHVLLGLRYAESGAKTIESFLETGAPGTGFGPDTEESAWIPRVGVVYDLTDNHSIYASYGESFLPPFTNSLDRSGNPITDAEVGKQWEVGYRGELFDGGLSATVAAFDLRKENVIVPTGAPNISDLAGEQRSRGLEVDLTGRIGEFLDLFFSYAYVDTEVLDAGTGSQTEGERFAGVPLHKAVLWSNLDMDWTGISGLTLGYGLDYMSAGDAQALVDAATLSFGTIALPAQGVIHNANITYERDTDVGLFNAVLGVSNLTDREYVLNTTNTLFARRGQRRTVMLTTSISF